MSSISIYQSVTDLNDSTLETLVSDCQNIMVRGQEAVTELCMNIAQQDAYLNTLKKKDKKAKLAMVIAKLNIKDVTWRKYSKIGRYYLDNPDARQLSMNTIETMNSKPKQLAAPTPKPPKTDLNAELEQAKLRITRLEREVKDLKNEVDYLKEERDDVCGWLDKNTRSGSTGVYEKLGRTLH